MIHGRRHGIPRSGKAYDAFPSGHAMHVGAIASAVSWISPKSAPLAWSLGGLVAATRIVLLAHWMTDVLAGLAMGVVVERCLRPLSAGAGPRADPHLKPANEPSMGAFPRRPTQRPLSPSPNH
jgi:membrane-associated phospholipid phosphatase